MYTISIKDIWYKIWTKSIGALKLFENFNFSNFSSKLFNLCKLRVIELKFCTRIH